MPWLETTIESVVGNRLGAAIYGRWVAALGLRGDERVLEIGTGAGACARHLAASLPDGELVCLDVDERWLAIARKRLARFEPRVEFVCADACTWSRPHAFNVAVAHFVLHDIAASQRRMALERVAESLCAGGRLHLREPMRHGMSADELRAQLMEVGFEQVGGDVLERVPLMGDTVCAVWRYGAAVA